MTGDTKRVECHAFLCDSQSNTNNSRNASSQVNHFSSHLDVHLTMTVDSNNYRYYTSGEIPDHPGDSWTRFVCISDTHSNTSIELPPGDVLIHAGDLTSRGTFRKLQRTINWLGSLPYEKKVYVNFSSLL